ncbi:MAG TPA: hypothetical protein VMH83_03035, partial [Candidatus Acidoferrum sp.]|nr:hypothetical protein [Candidatus Acidoferrum sp.]
SILGLQGGAPKGAVDTYDSALNQLTIPNVLVNGVTYTNVLITVGKIVSVGGVSSTFAGQIFKRDASASYLTNAGGEGIASAAISSGPDTATADASGQFNLLIPSIIHAADTLSVSAPGYVPIEIDRSIVDTKTPTNHFGLYPTQQVLKKPGFVLGIFTMDSGGHLNDIFNQGKFPSTYDRIVQKTSANLVAVSDPTWVTALDANAGTVTMSRNYSIPMMTKDQYRSLTDLARQRNLKFLMQIGVYMAPGIDWPWQIPATNTRFWDAWFAAYKSIVLEQVQTANELGIDYISLGMNSGFMSRLPSSYWSDLINSIRAAGYKGKLVYQAGSDLSVSPANYESDAFAPGFAGLFDYLVVNVYSLAQPNGSSPVVSRSVMKANMQSLLAKYSAYPVPIMIQIGTPSVESGVTSSEYIEPCVVCSEVTRNRTMDLFTQADAYQAVFESINDGKTGNGNVVGILSWGYWYSNNYRVEIDQNTHDLNSDDTLIDYTGTNNEGAYDKSASIRGKPAESLVKWWMDNLK